MVNVNIYFKKYQHMKINYSLGYITISINFWYCFWVYYMPQFPDGAAQAVDKTFKEGGGE